MAVALVTHRRFLSRELLSPFYTCLWMKAIPTPLKRRPEQVLDTHVTECGRQPAPGHARQR
jgi:hypothetical protein